MAKMGRPTEYKPEYVDLADEYLKTCVDEEREFHKTRGEKTNSYERHVKVKLPTLEGFSLFLDVDTESLKNWAKDHLDFLGALNRIREEQKHRLLNKGLSGDYNSTIAKLILSSNHGMREGVDHTTNNKDLPTPLLHALRDNNSD